jgi:hypothetical protein
MPRKKKRDGLLPRLGKLEPRYRFFLNPYPDYRLTSCPECGAKTKVRKLPLVIHIDPDQNISLNKVCRLCPPCDLLIVHQDELEAFLAAFFGDFRPEIIGNKYLVLGTQDRSDWLQGMKSPRTPSDALEDLHDFRDYLSFTPAPRWGPA